MKRMPRRGMVAASFTVAALLLLAAPASSSSVEERSIRGTSSSVDEFFQSPELHAGHSIVLRLYWAVLDRKPELGGAQFWVDTYNAGEWDVRRIAAHFVVSQEFQDRYGALDNAAFVDLIYRNVLDRAPDAVGYQFWLDQVNAGMSRAEMVLLISNDTEFIGNHPLPSDGRPDIGPIYLTPLAQPEIMRILDEFRFGNELPPNCAEYWANYDFSDRIGESAIFWPKLRNTDLDGNGADDAISLSDLDGDGLDDAAFWFRCKSAGTASVASLMIILADGRTVYTVDDSGYRDLFQQVMPAGFLVEVAVPDFESSVFSVHPIPGTDLIGSRWSVLAWNAVRGQRIVWPVYAEMRFTGSGFEIVATYDDSGDV